MVLALAGLARGAVTDLEGQSHLLQGRVTAIVFLDPECPICRSEMAEINEIAAHVGSRAQVLGVISDPTVTRIAGAAFAKEYGSKFPLLFDGSGDLAARFKPTVEPEAFVLDGRGTVKYFGRIDDAFERIGKQREVVMSHDLKDALVAVIAGKEPEHASVAPVGCVFESWKGTSIAPTKVTYARDIAPILNSNCVTCHRDGEVAPFSLMTYQEAAKHAEEMVDVTESKYMPPWKAEIGYGHFMDERVLAPRDIELIKRWAADGTAEGNPADLPPAPAFSSDWHLGTPDKVVTMAEAFDVPARGRDVYRAFVLPLDLPPGTYVSGVEFRPGAKSVVHHALFYLDTTGTARELDAKDPGPGYHTFGGVGFQPSGSLGGWAPGAMPYLLEDGIAREVPPKADLVIQVHYHSDGKAHQDKSSIAIYYAKKPVKHVVSGAMLISRQIYIPAGDADYHRETSVVLPMDVTVLGIVPHMHLIGREMKVTATTPDGETIPLIHVPDWDFKWQGQYRYAEPIRLKKGTKIEMTARYDNSVKNAGNPNSPPKLVTWGEQTTDEMCICFLQLTLDDPHMRRGLNRELIRQQLLPKVPTSSAR
jgi:peroxiredoxin